MLTGSLSDWQHAYAQGADAAQLLEAQRQAIPDGDPAWISVATAEHLAQQVDALRTREAELGRDALPLYGVPFAVKDNIDVAGLVTTAACPAFAYMAERDAVAVQRLRAAGAIVLGKTNLDQFATGLVGARSPYGVVSSVFDSARVSGGSSSGSASAVARGQVPFALSTDTAGSGRIPAGFNQIVGIKPTPGAVSGTGLVPACRTLDCVGVLATSVADSASVLAIMEGVDEADPYAQSRPRLSASTPLRHLRVATPAGRRLSPDYEAAFAATLAQLGTQAACVQDIDFTPLFEVAALLYDGPWVAERVLGAQRIYPDQPEALLPVIRTVLDAAGRFSAADTFAAQYRLQTLKQTAQALWQEWDVLCVPTAPRHPRIDELQAQPIAVNSELGVYTNFVNLLGWSAIAIPAARLPDGLPFGITLIAPAWHEPQLAHWAQQLEQQWRLPAGVTDLLPEAGALPQWHVPTHGDCVRLAVVGAHLRGMPLNHELQACGARFAEATYTAPDYRLYALPGTTPQKPGLSRVQPGAGTSIALEVWEMPVDNFGAFVAGVPAPLGIGSVTLASGETVKGFICEAYALAGATDISEHGGWRAYCMQQSGQAPARHSAAPQALPEETP